LFASPRPKRHESLHCTEEIRMSSRVTSFLACLALFAGLAHDAMAERQFSAMAPAAAKSRAPIDALSAGIVPSSTIVLEALAASKVQALREKASRGGSTAIQVGVVRDIPATASARSMQLEWQATGAGRALQWRVRASDAQALRIALDVRNTPAGVIARFASVSRPAEVFSQALQPAGLVWGPLLSGDEALVELFAPAGVDARAIDVSIARVADHFANPSLPDAIAKSQWLAAPCEVDLVCEAGSDPVLERAGAASIKLNWIEGYSAYACSGTLLNAADRSFRPYVYTASHCIAGQAAADSLVTFWFYEKASCGGEETRASVQLAGGAVLLATDDTVDATLLRLNRTPPEGAVFAGWDSSAPSLGESLTALHHANGEVTKVSHGTVVGAPPYPRFALAWTSGIVQGGSSGSGAFSRVGSDLLMRGGLSSANASCSAPGVGYYSRLDLAWPMIAPWLSVAPEHANATGLWWNAADPGWGLSLNQQGDTVFGVLFTYADDGRASWLVASGLQREGSAAFSGPLYRASAKGVSQAGSMRVALVDANTATLEYSADGRAVTYTITRQAFNGVSPVCVGTTSSRANATAYQDLWWDPADPGWGLGLAQQGDTIFATLFTYDDQGRDTWLAGSSVARQADGAFTGDLYRTSLAASGTGKSVKVASAGSIRLSFADGEHATAAFTVDGRAFTKDLVRQVFGPSAPLCR
jgi:lysyl endopeptidase